MLRLALEGALARRRRLASTTIAVILGVAFLAGTLALGDTLRSGFADLFTEAGAGTDVVVRGDTRFTASDGPRDVDERPPLDIALADDLAGVDGVDRVVPVISGYGQIIGADGEPVGAAGPPRIAGSWIDDEDLNPYEIVEGRAPRAPGEVVLNRGAAEDGGLSVGDRTIVEVPDPVEVTVVGIATFAGEDGLGEVTYAAFTTEEAARLLLGDTAHASSFSIRAADGVDPAELRDRVAAILPTGAEALTGAQVTDEARTDLENDFLDLLTGFVTAFGVIALLVATLSTATTFSTLVAQRSRESALLRALGASRRQVLGATLIETVLVGAVGSLVGIAAGDGMVRLLVGMFHAFGFPFPIDGIVYDGGTIVTGLVVGILAAAIAGIAPAVRASRSAPLAAVRDVAIDRSAASRGRMVAGALLTVAGVAVVLRAQAAADPNLGIAGLGAALSVVGVVTLGPTFAGPVAGALRRPLGRLRGITGALAADGAARNPRRTAASASALLVGVAVATLFTVFGASLKTSTQEAIDDTFAGDLAVRSSTFGASGVSPRLAEELRTLDEVDGVAGLAVGVGRLDGKDVILTGTDSADLPRVVDLDVTDGSLADLGPGTIALSTDQAENDRLAVGDVVDVEFVDGTTTSLELVATYDGEQVVGSRLVDRSTLAGHVQQAMDTSVLVSLRDGVSLEDGRRAVESVTASFGSPDVQDRATYAASLSGRVDMFLGVIYALLALAIVIALLGIANTTSLAIYERTHELGLLRAVGQARAQVRSMVRLESTVVAVFGTVGGLGLGTFLGWALSKAGGDLSSAFTVPVGQLVVVLVLGAVAGVLAGVRPARRAARLDVLAAIAVAG